MQGSSRTALTSTRRVLNGTLSGLSDPKATARDLFAVIDVMDTNATLRRAFADSSRDADAKRGLATLCIGGGMGVAMCVERG